MTLIEMTTQSGDRVAVLPTGGLFIRELKGPGGAANGTQFAGQHVGILNVRDPYETVIQNFNAQLESWGR